MDGSKQQFEYKAEMKQLLHLIAHSLYTNTEIFVRELVSNSSDALNKLRFKKLTDSNIIDPESDLKISIEIDKDNNTFSIEDTGVGMTKDDLINEIGTVAKSGTLEFLKKIKENKKSLDSNLIGQFGVGFYSIFMVTDEVTIETRYCEEGSEAYRFVSSGQDTFTIEESDRQTRGTKISFKLNEENKEFAEKYRIDSILNKYSNFVDFPLYLNGDKVNTVQAIWHKKKDDVGQEELNEFYKYIANDSQEPLGHLHLDIEGTVNFKALIFMPKTAPPMLFRDAGEKTLHLYTSKVFIQDDAKELLPDYLRFLKGVVDTEDLPLNVSREVTQNSPVMTKIKNVLTSRVLSMLQDWADKEKGKYEEFFKNFGSLFKTGINSDFSNKDKIIELLRFESSSTKAGELTSFNGYVSRMKPDQKEIFYISGQHRDAIENNPNLEYFRDKELEVIYLTDPVDYFTFPYIREYDEKNIVSIDKADIDIEKDEKQEEKLSEDASKSLIDKFKEVLGDKVENIIESKRLVSSPVTLVVGNQGMDAQMEKMMQMLDQSFTASKRILEVNMSHPIIKNLHKLFIADSNDPLIGNSINQLFDGAMLLEGQMKSPSEFVERMHDIMEKATK